MAQKSNPVIPPQSYRYRRVPEMEQLCPPTSIQLPSTNKTSDDNPSAMANLRDPLPMRWVVAILRNGMERKGTERNATKRDFSHRLTANAVARGGLVKLYVE